VCPSNPPTTIGGPQLAYIVNGGLEWQTTGTSLPETVNNAAGAATSEFAFNGVCFNAAAGLTGAAGISGVRVGSDYVSSNDGATYTALLTENNQAAFWTLYTTAGNPVMAWAAGSTGVTGEATLAYYLKNDNTFVWYQLGASNASPSTVPNGEGTFPTSTLYRINGNKTALPPASASSYAGAGLARPSSNHTGGVNLFFCDGHYRFIAEDVNYLVLRQLMTSNYQATANYVAQAAGSTNYMNMPLDDSMY
jgi:prepilin-type processing-associated H-X9-DG protein